MAKMTIRKTAFAIAAVVALAFTGNAAQAGTYEFDYTLTSILSGSSVTMMLQASDTGVASGGFEEYAITGLYGIGNYANQLSLLTPAQAGSIIPSNNPAAGSYNFTTDNLLYVNAASKQFALDDEGFAFSGGSGTYYNVYFNDIANPYLNSYVQSVDAIGTNGNPLFTLDAQIVGFSIRQVPTPGSLALIGSGLLGLGLLSLRKKLI